MGVAVRSIETVGHTDQLVDWITKVRCKKVNARKQRRKNLLMEAVLASALMKAETELRHKQQERLRKWQQIKSSWSSNNSFSSHTTWDLKTCEELSSLDDFMFKLKQVKCQIGR